MAVTIANQTTHTDFGVTSTSFSHTSSGTNPCLILVVTFSDDAGGVTASGSGATFNGDNLAFIGGTDASVTDAGSGTRLHTEIWGLLNPDEGTFTCQFSFANEVAPLSIAIQAYTLAGVDGTTPIGTGVKATGTDDTPTVDATSQTDGLVIDALIVPSAVTSMSVGAGQTERMNTDAFSVGRHGSSTEAGAASVTMSWTLNTAEDWAIAAVPVNPLSAPPAALSISVFDALLVPDVIVVQSVQKLSTSVFDTVSVAEFTSIGRTIGPSRFDTVTLSEFAFIDLSIKKISVFDSLLVSEAVFLTSIPPVEISVSDAVGVNVGAAKISWNANTEPDLAGYKLYYGTSSGVYTTVIDVGLTSTPSTPNYTVYNLTKGITYYFNVTAYDTSNNESAFGTEVSKLIRGPVGNWYQVSVLLPSISPVDSVTVSESVTVRVLPKPFSFDTISTAEFWQVFIANVGSVGIDTLIVSEFVSLTLATAPTLTPSASDLVTVTESISITFVGQVTASSSVTIAESSTVNIIMGVDIADSVTVAEDVTVTFPTSQVAPFDIVTVQDAVTVQMDKVLLSVFDSIFTGEGHDGRFVVIGTGDGDGTGRVTKVAGISNISVIT